MVGSGGAPYVILLQDPVSHAITDFISFYTLPSTVINNKLYNTLKAAYP